jgi:hypothetical protein
LEGSTRFESNHKAWEERTLVTVQPGVADEQWLHRVEWAGEVETRPAREEREALAARSEAEAARATRPRERVVQKRAGAG